MYHACETTYPLPVFAKEMKGPLSKNKKEGPNENESQQYVQCTRQGERGV